METVTRHLRFASDAELLAWVAGLCLLFALFALWAERRRGKRRNLDAVGWVPWNALFFMAAFAGAGLGAAAIKGLVAG